MIVYPAIDLRGGRCVRLVQGNARAETEFAADPVEVALRWEAEGAAWLHIVNLDGAFGASATTNLDALAQIISRVDVPIQWGGGVRSPEGAGRLLDLGVARVIFGTVAVTDPDIVGAAVQRFGAERVVVGLDARDGRVATHGWQEATLVDAVTHVRRMAALGVRRIVYTDVARDGMMHGVDAHGAAALARAGGVGVIASGGVSTLEDLRLLKAREAEGVEGVVIGMALYRGAIALSDAIAVSGGD